ncbi:molybdopterin molybdotransferase MoeA [Schlesneria paludicola]|uniref:molybdopterin molybdotransferase MoeA n=1 Tax=Schlesneria paludicola TaxID=360056 RepID=UPI00029AC71E|nr:gephyrin-like molybdotransferase Glp [Schlesneria paludicola]
MLTVTQALEQIRESVIPFEVSEHPLESALGLTLGEDVHSTVDSPPFDKSLMDGYAVRISDVESGSATLRVIELVTAGQVPQHTVNWGEATQIMTGAPLPAGADIVIKVEETQRQGDHVTIAANPPTANTNVIRRGTSIRTGSRVLTAGITLNAHGMGTLAELGQSMVRVRRRPRAAVLSTGDELVPVTATPERGQIRNSNGVMLTAQLEAAGAIAVNLGIARDNREDLAAKIAEGLKYDLLILSGGVSAGLLDLVPSTLAEAGVRQIFHKVEMKPGKPIWFGQRALSTTPTCNVFGLPGNPVGSLVCFELFVRTTIKRLMGAEPSNPQPLFARLEHDYSTRADRPTYHPARLTWAAEGLSVTLVPWHGSSDLCGTVSANGMVALPGEPRQFRAGDQVESFAW